MILLLFDFFGFADQFLNIGFSYIIDWLLSVNPHFV